MKEEDPVEEVIVVEEVTIEEVPSVEPHVAVSAATAAAAASFHFMQESELEITAEPEAPYDEEIQEEPILVVVEETVAEEAGDVDALEVCFFLFNFYRMTN